jgi:hypothetical protein
MNHTSFFSSKRLSTFASLLLLFILTGFAGWEKSVQAQVGGSAPDRLAEVRVEGGAIIWQPLVKTDGWMLTVTGPDGWANRYTFDAGAAPALALQDAQGQRLADGQYQYELRPVIQVETAPASGQSDTGRAVGLASALPEMLSVQAGTFNVQNGAFALPSGAAEPGSTMPASSADQPIGLADQVYADDLIVQGSQCVGFDCVDGESFGYDTIRLKENNLQIAFDDTSATAGFPANDWTIIANDAADGGANYLAFYDATGGRVPFKVVAGARTNALYVDSIGRIGLGTSTPVLSLHIVRSDSPSIRLDQDTTGGWAAQVWDLAGNESNFFIRDVTNGSRLPFRIQPGAPSNSLTMKSSGNVGLGTWSPDYSLEIERTGQDAAFVSQRTDGASAVMVARESTVQVGALTNHNLELVVNNTPVMTLDAQGNATLEGVLYEHSDVNVKEAFQPVDCGEVLDRLESLPITTWSYQNDAPGVRHMGPMAQDFHQAFGLGADGTHVASLDANGVALTAAQELLARVKDQEAEVDRLEAENQALKDRLDRLEALVSQALGTQSPMEETRVTWSHHPCYAK